jgi:hypothetical protein
MADEALNLTFQQFLNEQKKTNQLIHQQIMDDEQGDTLKASFKNAAAEIGNTVIQERKNRKEHDQTQEAIVKAERENTKTVESVETAIDKQTKTIENQNTQISARWDEQIKATKSAEATASKQNQQSQKQQTPLQQQVLALAQTQQLGVQNQQKQQMNLFDLFTSQELREKAILKLNDDQYIGVLEQREVVERTEKELKEINKSLGNAKDNKDYQRLDLQLKRDQAELAARENQTNVEFVKNSAEIAYETREREMRLLKVNEDQYEGILEQRKIVEDSTKKLKELGEAIKGDSKDNKEYQKKDLQLKREQAKLAARENKRGLLGRFKADVAASKPVQMLGDVKRKFIDPVKGFFKKFPKIISLALTALLLFFVNSKYLEKTRKFLKEYFSGKESLGEIVTDIIKVVGGLTLLGVVLKTLGTMLTAFAFGKIAAAAGGFGGGGGGNRGRRPRGRFRRMLGRVRGGVGARLGGVGARLLGAGASMLGLNAAAGGAGVAAARSRSAAFTSIPQPAANQSVKPSRSSGMSKFSHLNKFPRLLAIAKRIPFLGTALSAAYLAPILMDDTISKEKKIQAVGGALGAVLGGIGGAKLGALVGFLGGGPIGAFVGGILGSIGGFMFGDFVGLKLGEFLMTGKEPKSAAMTGKALTGTNKAEKQEANLKAAEEMQYKFDTKPERMKKLKELAAAGNKNAIDELKRLNEVRLKLFGKDAPVIRYETPKSLSMLKQSRNKDNSILNPLTPPATDQVAKMKAATADSEVKPAAPVIINNNTVTEGNTTEQSLSASQNLVNNSIVGRLGRGSLVEAFP